LQSGFEVGPHGRACVPEDAVHSWHFVAYRLGQVGHGQFGHGGHGSSSWLHRLEDSA
jgi:hypothetical protein